MQQKGFDVNITPEDSEQDLSVSELWKYRDLIVLLVRRDFIANYKQTILGPAWAVVQPIMSTIVTAIVFGNLAKMSPVGIPIFLFYMSGQVLWTFFSSCLTQTANTFLANMNVMGKVYFPRFVAPVASTISNFVSLFIQIVLFICFYIWYVINGYPVSINITVCLIPLYLIHLALLALGVGAILSALTTKYRDLNVLLR